MSLKRFNVLVCHRRFGKTVMAINHLLDETLNCKKPRPRFAYIAPFRTQAKTVAWDYLKHYTNPIPGREWNESELRCDLPGGGRVTLFGADNADALRGQYFDGVVLDEFGDMAPRVWSEVIRPALSDRMGWAIFIGTPKGPNHFADLYQCDGDYKEAVGEDWFRATYKASETGIVNERELKEARTTMTRAQYEQEFECSFMAAVLGAVYGEEFREVDAGKRIAGVPAEKGLPVHTAWDLGIGDSTAIWLFQIAGREIRVIDYIESFGVGLDWYARALKERPHLYGTHLLPHDANVKELGTGRSRVETLADYGIKATVLPNQRLEDGINAARGIFSRCWFDAEKCRDGVNSLRLYQYEYDDKRRTFSPRPRHDHASHAADAFRYLAMGLNKVEQGTMHQGPLNYSTPLEAFV